MAVHLSRSNGFSVERKLRFGTRFSDDIISLVHIITKDIISNYGDVSTTSLQGDVSRSLQGDVSTTSLQGDVSRSLQGDVSTSLQGDVSTTSLQGRQRGSIFPWSP